MKAFLAMLLGGCLMATVAGQVTPPPCLPTSRQFFDENFYRNQYPDLRNVGNLWAHFANHGTHEGRIARQGGCPGGKNPECRGYVTLDGQWYLNYHQDLKKAFGNNLQKAAQHYQEWGQAEYRAPCPGCCPGAEVCRLGNLDAGWYIRRYPDLMKAFNGNVGLAGQHWTNHGKAENRIPCENCCPGGQPPLNMNTNGFAPKCSTFNCPMYMQPIYGAANTKCAGEMCQPLECCVGGQNYQPPAPIGGGYGPGYGYGQECSSFTCSPNYRKRPVFGLMCNGPCADWNCCDPIYDNWGGSGGQLYPGMPKMCDTFYCGPGIMNIRNAYSVQCLNGICESKTCCELSFGQPGYVPPVGGTPAACPMVPQYCPSGQTVYADPVTCIVSPTACTGAVQAQVGGGAVLVNGQCSPDQQTCPDGKTMVGRDPALSCYFRPCDVASGAYEYELWQARDPNHYVKIGPFPVYIFIILCLVCVILIVIGVYCLRRLTQETEAYDNEAARMGVLANRDRGTMAAYAENPAWIHSS